MQVVCQAHIIAIGLFYEYYNAMPNLKRNTTIRLSDSDRQEIEQKMQHYGYEKISPFIRFAIRQLKDYGKK